LSANGNFHGRLSSNEFLSAESWFLGQSIGFHCHGFLFIDYD